MLEIQKYYNFQCVLYPTVRQQRVDSVQQPLLLGFNSDMHQNEFNCRSFHHRALYSKMKSIHDNPNEKCAIFLPFQEAV